MSSGPWSASSVGCRLPRYDDLAWQDRARCRGRGVTVDFYPEKSGPCPAASEAKRVCNGCPVQTACLEHALARGERGIWGGLTESERRELAAARRRNTAWRGVNA